MSEWMIQMIQMNEWTTEWNECGKAWEIIRTTSQPAIFSSFEVCVNDRHAHKNRSWLQYCRGHTQWQTYALTHTQQFLILGNKLIAIKSFFFSWVSFICYLAFIVGYNSSRLRHFPMHHYHKLFSSLNRYVFTAVFLFAAPAQMLG